MGAETRLLDWGVRVQVDFSQEPRGGLLPLIGLWAVALGVQCALEPGSVFSEAREEDQGCNPTPHAGVDSLRAATAQWPGLPLLIGSPT